jgi:hypothetical protein
MLLDITEPNYSQIVCDVVRMHVSGYLPELLRKSVKVQAHEMSHVDGLTISLTAKLLKSLVHRVEVLEPDVEEFSEPWPSNLEYVPDRPIDHLIEFACAYLPTRIADWLRGFQRERSIQVDNYTVNIKRVVNVKNYYHMMPWHFTDEKQQVRFMSWQGDFYNGTPEEWKDLQCLRDSVLDLIRNHSTGQHSLSWADESIHKLIREAQQMKLKAARCGEIVV